MLKLAALALCLSGCAAHHEAVLRRRDVNAEMAAWVNHPVSEVISAWGEPTSAAQPGRPERLVGAGTAQVSFDNGIVEWYSPGCRKRLDVRRGTVVSWHRQGC